MRVVKSRPGKLLTLRQKARVIMKSQLECSVSVGTSELLRRAGER